MEKEQESERAAQRKTAALQDLLKTGKDQLAEIDADKVAAEVAARMKRAKLSEVEAQVAELDAAERAARARDLLRQWAQRAVMRPIRVKADVAREYREATGKQQKLKLKKLKARAVAAQLEIQRARDREEAAKAMAAAEAM